MKKPWKLSFLAPVFVYNTEFTVLHKSVLWTRGWRKPMFWQHLQYILYNQDYLRMTITPSAVFPVPSPLWPEKLHPSYFKSKRFQQPAVQTSFREFYRVHIFLKTKYWPELSICHTLKCHYDQIFTSWFFRCITWNSMKEWKRCLPFANTCISSGDIQVWKMCKVCKWDDWWCHSQYNTTQYNIMCIDRAILANLQHRSLKLGRLIVLQKAHVWL